MPVVKWTLYDPVAAVTVPLPINPNEGGTPSRRKNLLRRATTAPDGRTIVFEGLDDPGEIKVSGTLLSEAHLDLLNEWFDKRHQIQVTDDLGRQYWIYIESFEATRIRRRSHPWAHTYNLSAVILDWPA